MYWRACDIIWEPANIWDLAWIVRPWSHRWTSFDLFSNYRIYGKHIGCMKMCFTCWAGLRQTSLWLSCTPRVFFRTALQMRIRSREYRFFAPKDPGLVLDPSVLIFWGHIDGGMYFLGSLVQPWLHVWWLIPQTLRFGPVELLFNHIQPD